MLYEIGTIALSASERGTKYSSSMCELIDRETYENEEDQPREATQACLLDHGLLARRQILLNKVFVFALESNKEPGRDKHSVRPGLYG